jgi:hypothetical protein
VEKARSASTNPSSSPRSASTIVKLSGEADRSETWAAGNPARRGSQRLPWRRSSPAATSRSADLARPSPSVSESRASSGPSVGGREQMAHVDQVRRVVEDRRLDRPVEELLGMAAEELVERVVARHVEREAAAAPSGAAPLLAKARDRAGKGDRDRGVEVSDVDPELERASRDDPEKVTLGEPPLELATLLRRVAGAVGSDPALALRVVQPRLRELVDQLRGSPRPGEADRPHVGRDQVGEERRRLAEARRAPPGSLVEQRGIAHHDFALPTRRAIPVDEPEVQAGQSGRKLNRVRDRRRREHEAGRGPVLGREAPEAAEHVCHVRPEHPAIDVCLVDDDQREVREEVTPPIVVGEDPDVQHVRVGQDQVGALADRGALALRRVAVVDRVPQPRDGQRGQAAGLVLRERLRRIEIERPRAGIDREHVKDRKVEAERLPACGPGRHDRVPVPHDCVPGFRLMREEGVDPDPRERFADRGVQVVGNRRRLRLVGLLARRRDQPLVLAREEPFEHLLGRNPGGAVRRWSLFTRARQPACNSRGGNDARRNRICDLLRA